MDLEKSISKMEISTKGNIRMVNLMVKVMIYTNLGVYKWKQGARYRGDFVNG